MTKFKVGDYFLTTINGFNGIPSKIVAVSKDGSTFTLEYGCEWYYHSWMTIIPKDVYESPLYQVLS